VTENSFLLEYSKYNVCISNVYGKNQALASI